MTVNKQTYEPCRNGIHVCDNEITVLNIPLDVDVARYSFAAALVSDVALPDADDTDVDVELRIGGDLVDGFGMRRQMVARLREIVRDA